ncbi:MAG TPA: hypothetical protein VHV51_17095 [Polyangiaceae bacterium]|nr:hypothetical protein [Polyangiaceae bacterium]
MSERAIHVGVLVGAIALATWVFGVRAWHPHASRSAASERASPLAIIPPGAAFVLTADIAQLRHAALGSALAAHFAKLGAGDLSHLCGFDPLASLDQLALAVPEAGEQADAQAEDFGIVATGHFTAAQIMDCATAAIRARSGDPVSTALGNFSSVRDRKAEGGEVAARDGGPLIVSGGSYFRALLDAAAGNAPKLEHQDPRDARHVALRRALGAGTIVATWLLSPGWFERVSGDNSGRLSPLRSLTALAARVAVDRDARVTVFVDSADDTNASDVKALLEQLQASLASLPLDPTLSGAARRVVISERGARLTLTLTLTQAELEALLDTLDGERTHTEPARPAAHPDAP